MIGSSGAVAPTWLALLPENVEEPRGGYVWYKKELVDWIHGPLPGKPSSLLFFYLQFIF